jgi:hypothetical protein
MKTSDTGFSLLTRPESHIPVLLSKVYKLMVCGSKLAIARDLFSLFPLGHAEKANGILT